MKRALEIARHKVQTSRVCGPCDACGGLTPIGTLATENAVSL